MWQHFPLTASSSVQLYDCASELWAGVRQRQAITASSTRWPTSSHPWISGIITAITDNGDGTIDLRANDDAGSPIDWDAQFTAIAALDYGPASFQISLFPSDDPNATAMGDPARGLCYAKTAHDSTDLTITDDGRLALNGLTLADYVGYAFQVLRSGSGTQGGFAWFLRYPPRPNEAEHDYGSITSSTTTSITDNRGADSDAWQTPKPWPAKLKDDDGKWREVLFKVGVLWKRATITGAKLNDAGEPTITFAAQTAAPTGEYWIVDAGAWWRPEFRLKLVKCTGRDGDFGARPYSPMQWTSGGEVPWSSAGSAPWSPAIWNSVYTDESYTSHSPVDDTLVSVPKFVETVELSLGTTLCEDTDVTVWDVDAATSYDDVCGNEDRKLNAYLYWSLRGLELAIEQTLGAAQWVSPVDHSGEASIPVWRFATWQKYHTPANTRTATISAVSGGGVATIAIAMPAATPGQTYASLPCWLVVLDATGDVKREDTGTVTATSLTTDNVTLDATDEGKSVIIAFGWTRRFERRVRYLYPRTVFVPDTDEGGGAIIPPTSGDPGYYQTTDASSHYAEYADKGELTDGSQAFLDGESARYVGDNLLDPFPQYGGELGAWLDIGYQGRPALDGESSFPRWEASARTGTITAVDTAAAYIEDSAQDWQVGSTPLASYSGTSTGGSTTTLIDTGRSTDGRWLTANRFVGMILAVSFDSGTTYERRPITAYDSATQTITVSPAFTQSAASMPYILSEPGYGTGAILNLWRGRRLTLHRAGGSSASTTILYSDATRLYFAPGAFNPAPAIGDTYSIEQLEPGIVVQRKSHADAVNGWLPTSHPDAIADPRGQAWHGDEEGGEAKARENCPTMVNAYGRIRRGDISAQAWWNERWRAIDCLRWTKTSVAWSSREDPDVPENNHKEGGATDGSAPSGYSSCATRKGYGTTGYQAGTPTEASGAPFVSASHRYVPDPGGSDMWQLDMVNQYAYAVTSVSELLPATIDVYGRAIIDVGDPENNVEVANVLYVFEDKGTGIGYRVYGLMGSANVVDGEARVKVGVDLSATPDWGPCPDETGDGQRVQSGFRVESDCGIVKWGLTYVS